MQAEGYGPLDPQKRSLPLAPPTTRTRIYRGSRDNLGACIVTVHECGVTRVLDARYELRRHSPDGFNWGYCGSGPAQLALALLANATGDDITAQVWYQVFKARFVSRFRSDVWDLSAVDVLAALAELIPDHPELVAREADEREAEAQIREYLREERSADAARRDV